MTIFNKLENKFIKQVNDVDWGQILYDILSSFKDKPNTIIIENIRLEMLSNPDLSPEDLAMAIYNRVIDTILNI